MVVRGDIIDADTSALADIKPSNIRNALAHGFLLCEIFLVGILSEIYFSPICDLLAVKVGG